MRISNKRNARIIIVMRKVVAGVRYSGNSAFGSIEIVKLRFKTSSLVLTMLQTWHKNSFSRKRIEN